MCFKSLKTRAAEREEEVKGSHPGVWGGVWLADTTYPSVTVGKLLHLKVLVCKVRITAVPGITRLP